jgi:hypothetical protein
VGAEADALESLALPEALHEPTGLDYDVVIGAAVGDGFAEHAEES